MMEKQFTGSPDAAPELGPESGSTERQEPTSGMSHTQETLGKNCTREAAGKSGARKAPEKGRTWKALRNLLIKVAVIVLLLWLALTFVFGVFRLSGNNMYPMLKDGDLCVTYRLEEYHSSDVVAYRIDGRTHFGRIVARAGDTVDGDAQGILINGMYPSEEVFYPTQMQGITLDLPVTLGEGQFMILNDHREDLSDSRTYGVINKEDLEGKIIFIFRRRGF